MMKNSFALVLLWWFLLLKLLYLWMSWNKRRVKLSLSYGNNNRFYSPLSFFFELSSLLTFICLCVVEWANICAFNLHRLHFFHRITNDDNSWRWSAPSARRLGRIQVDDILAIFCTLQKYTANSHRSLWLIRRFSLDKMRWTGAEINSTIFMHFSCLQNERVVVIRWVRANENLFLSAFSLNLLICLDVNLTRAWVDQTRGAIKTSTVMTNAKNGCFVHEFKSTA